MTDSVQHSAACAFALQSSIQRKTGKA